MLGVGTKKLSECVRTGEISGPKQLELLERLEPLEQGSLRLFKHPLKDD
jgi:hypothetical protein